MTAAAKEEIGVEVSQDTTPRHIVDSSGGVQVSSRILEATAVHLL